MITEWQATNPAANTFEGTRRELLRVAHIVMNLTHPMGYVGFNPTAKPGSPDYGLLYTSGSDHGFSNGGGPNANNPSQTQRLDSVITAILRIDPRSPSVTKGVKGLGDYTIPMANKFAADSDPKTLGEIYAYGFRNAHRLSWDMTDGTMFACDIGMNNIEEVNIVRNGENYGWMKREGYWENGMIRPGGDLDQLFALPAEILDGRKKDEFTYPVAIYDHNEGAGHLRRVRVSRQDRGAARQVRVRRHPARTAVRLRSRRDEEGRRRRSRRPSRRSRRFSCTCATRGNRVYVTLRDLIERTMGATRHARGSAHQPQPRRRVVHHVAPGRHHSDARARVRQVERRLQPPRVVYTRSAPTGSIRAARAAGIRLASTVTTTNTTGTTKKVVASVVLTSNSSDCKSRVLAYAPAKPHTSPMSVTRSP